MVGDRLPPQNLEAERSTLACCIIDANLVDDVILITTADDFYRDRHQELFRHILKLRSQGSGAVDLVLLVESLRSAAKFEELGGHDFLAEIMESVPTAANYRQYANIVREKSKKRIAAMAASEILNDSYSDLMTADEILESAEAKIFAVRDSSAAGGILTASELVAKTMEVINLRRASGAKMLGTPSGFGMLDYFTSGFQRGQVTILAARPGQGKSALALNVADNVTETGENVLFISLEMGWLELTNRILSGRARVTGDKFQSPTRMSNQDHIAVANAAGEFAKCSFMIDDTPGRTVPQIAGICRRVKSKHGLGLVIIDYLGLIDEPHAKSDNEQTVLARKSEGVRRIARTIDVPILALHQLNRNIENRDDPTPRMSDIRGSGQIEQDAHVILLLTRPKGFDHSELVSNADLYIAKNRNGCEAKIALTFERPYTKFVGQSNLPEPDRNGSPF